MNELFVHIEPKEIQYEDSSVSLENKLNPIDSVASYVSRECHKTVIPSDSVYHDLAHKTYKAFYLKAGDYVLVSKWQNGVMLSEVNTMFVFEFVDNCNYDIQVKNMSGDNIEISYGFYYGE